jgi:iron-sulfur cluster repair protein YtfE (RIC family)
MNLITQPLRDEHKDLFPHVEGLRLAGDAVSGPVLSPDALRLLKESNNFLTHHLIPHAEAEEKALYPVVQKVMGASQATATMSRDHVEVGALTRELTDLRHQLTGITITADQANDLRRVLYGLYTLVKVHFAKEEEIYLPLMDAKLTAGEADAMFKTMEAAAGEAKSRLH